MARVSLGDYRVAVSFEGLRGNSLGKLGIRRQPGAVATECQTWLTMEFFQAKRPQVHQEFAANSSPRISNPIRLPDTHRAVWWVPTAEKRDGWPDWPAPAWEILHKARTARARWKVLASFAHSKAQNYTPVMPHDMQQCKHATR